MEIWARNFKSFEQNQTEAFEKIMIDVSTIHFVLNPDLSSKQLNRLCKSISQQGISYSIGFDNFENKSLDNARWLAIVDSYVVINFKKLRNFFTTFQFEENHQLVYFDSSFVSNFRKKLIRRPTPSPERLRGQDYLGSFILVRNDRDFLVNILSSKQYSVTTKLSLGLTAVETNSAIHFPKSVVTEQDSPITDLTQDEVNEFKQVLAEYLDRTGGGHVEEITSKVSFKTHRVLVNEPLVSILIPSRARWETAETGKKSLLLNAINSVLEKTSYQNIEFVVIYDEDAEPEILNELRSKCGNLLKLVKWSHPFDFSGKMNLGAAHSSGVYLLFLNDDVEVISPSWLSSMIALNQLKDVGMVGAFLYYEDGTVQHGGHTIFNGAPTHIGLWADPIVAGKYPGFKVDREVYGVTAACASIEKSLFTQIGGFSSLLPGNFNDVDLNQKVRFLGKSIVIAAGADLFHFESKTRDARVHYYELDVINHRWGHTFIRDEAWPLHPIAVDKWI